MYLDTFSYVVSVILVRVSDRHQRYVFYINKALVDSETHYTNLKRIILALRTATKKLRAYF